MSGWPRLQMLASCVLAGPCALGNAPLGAGGLFLMAVPLGGMCPDCPALLLLVCIHSAPLCVRTLEHP